MSGNSESLTFLDLEAGQCPLADSHRNLIKSLIKPSQLPLPGEVGVWETPKRRSPECEFGEATAILKELKLNPNAAVFEFPSPTNSVSGGDKAGGEDGGGISVGGFPQGHNDMEKPPLVRKLSASSAPFVPNIPIPSFPTSHAQTIHINNLTANVNYHVQQATPPSTTTATPSSGGKPVSGPPGGAPGPSVHLPFTVNGAYINHYPPNQHMNYQPPVVVYQDPINMYYSPHQGANNDKEQSDKDQKYTPVVSVKEKLAAPDDEPSPPATASVNMQHTHNFNSGGANSNVSVTINNNSLPQQQQHKQPGVGTMPPPPFGKPTSQYPVHPGTGPELVKPTPPFQQMSAPRDIVTSPPAQSRDIVTSPPAQLRDIVTSPPSKSQDAVTSNNSQSYRDVENVNSSTGVTFGGDDDVIRSADYAKKAAGGADRITTEAEPEKTPAMQANISSVPPPPSNNTVDISSSQNDRMTDNQQVKAGQEVGQVKAGKEDVAVHQEAASSQQQQETASSQQQQPVKTTTWASLFKSQTASPQVSVEKPMAMIPPFTAVAAASSPLGAAATSSLGAAASASPTPPSVPQDIADTKARQFGEFLLNYKLSHYSTSLLPAGLSNRSNWCFVNAILQALVACPPFYNLFKQINTTIGIQGLIGTKTAKVQAILGFIKEFSPLETIVKPQKKEKMRKKEDIRTGACFEPSSVYKMLLNLPPKDTFQVVEGRQEDAEEFLTCLLNGLSDEMTDIIKMIPKQQGEQPPQQDEEAGEDQGDEDADDWKEVNSKGRHCVTRRVVSQEDNKGTPIQALALGMCRSIVRCGSGEISATLQPFYTLQLDIQHPEVDSLNQALLKNFDQEEIEGYKNQKTNQIVKATRCLNLEELPSILILHMKRFVYDVNTGGVQKTLKPVQFSVDLEIPKTILSNETRSKFSQRQRQYKLFAVVCHYGKEATKGHYVTDVYHTGYGCWLHCDDGTVTETAEESVLTPSQNSTPYILFYRRCDTVIGQEKKEPKVQQK